VDTLDVECGAIIAHHPSDIANFFQQLRRCHPKITTVVWAYEFLPKDDVFNGHDEGFRIFAYDVELANDFSRCRDFSVAGVITNRPDVVLHKSC
jgi:hypothetical protein